MLSGVQVGSTTGDLLVLASTSAQALQIVMVERYANRYDAIALTLVEMATCSSVSRDRDRPRRPLGAARLDGLGR